MVAALLLASCSAVRLGYQGAPQLSWWWLDSQFDVPSEHAPRVRAEVDRVFEWHRRSQLPGWADWLAVTEARLGEPLSAAQVCSLYDQARRLLQPTLDRAWESAADLAPLLGTAQLVHLERKLAERLAEARRELATADAAARRDAQVQRLSDRAERVYGSLTDAQRRLVEASVASSPWDPLRTLDERERRQRDLLQTLRRWQAERPDRAQRLAAIRQLAERAETGLDPADRARREQLARHQCRLAADLHNASTPAQRRKARAQFRSWEEDFRALAADRREPVTANPG